MLPDKRGYLEGGQTSFHQTSFHHFQETIYAAG